jgi:hypothetical protein
MRTPTNLKQAQADPKAMKQFVVEHEGEQIESTDFDKVMTSMLGQEKPKATLATSSKDFSDDCK